jgi:hypothetical protein
MPLKYSNSLDNFNYAFAVVFNIECLLKLIAIRKFYFFNYWNIFDFLVVILTDLGIIMKLASSNVNFASAATVVRSFRIMRIFKLIRASKNLKVLLDTIMHILPSLANIGSLIFLILFIYSVLGINLFAEVMYQD